MNKKDNIDGGWRFYSARDGRNRREDVTEPVRFTMFGIKMPVLYAAGSANPLDFFGLHAGPTIHPITSGHLNAGGRSSTGTSLKLGNLGVRLEALPVLCYSGALTYGAAAQATPRGGGLTSLPPSTWNFTPNQFRAIKTGVSC